MKRIAAVLALLLFLPLVFTPRQSVFAAPATFTFDPKPNGPVYALALQPDGKILVGGQFTTLYGQLRNNFGRLNADGSLDVIFRPDANSEVFALAVQGNGMILAGGSFTTMRGLPRQSLARISTDGVVDNGFLPSTDGVVYAMAVQPDGKILVGGSFTKLNGQPYTNLGRLTANGYLDATFHPEATITEGISGVTSLAVQPDGRIVVGGLFDTLGGQPRENIGRLNADGSLDTIFNPGAGYHVSTLAVQPDGKILVGGSFSTLGGQVRASIGRLNPDGSLDTAFSAAANGSVETLALQTDGKILVGGAFSQLGGQPRESFGRLNPNGSLDTTFNLAINNTILALALQGDGQILLGGYTLQRALSDTTVSEWLVVDSGGKIITWHRSGASPEVDRVTFELSGDGITYTMLGSAKRVPGGWELSGLNLPRVKDVSIRARGYYSTGFSNGSVSIVQYINTFHLAPAQTGPVFTVNTTAEYNDGLCSTDDCTLREAINAANARTNGTSPDEIHFNISTGCDAATGICTIAPISALPDLKDPVVIDGYTQPGASANTLAVGNNARLLIELNGANTLANTNGLVSRTSSTIRGLVINRFKGTGIYLAYGSTTKSTVDGNFIGSDPSGATALGNAGNGIYIEGSQNTIGGTKPGARNLISGNSRNGILISGVGNEVLGNYVGTNAAGTASLGNKFDGIEVSYIANNIIGGTVSGSGNLISGNGYSGLHLYGSTTKGTVVQGNYFGTDGTGRVSIGNRSSGIWVEEAANSTIGGPIPAARNLISGNGYYGMVLNNGATGNIVQGNHIGVDITGAVSIGNGNDGISIVRATNTIIGGTAAQAGNIISGNGRHGISTIYSTGTIVQGNFIGTNMTRTALLGNAGYGIDAQSGSALIGGTTTGTGNVIANNALDGIHIYFYDGSAAGNTVEGNAIYNNGGLGIGINEDGVTHNDAGDADTGNNNLQNFPLLSSLNSGVIGGMFNSAPGTTFRVEFFANAACDPSGYGEGQQFLGAQDITTNGDGNAAFTFAFTPVSGKPYYTATATNTLTGDTSEFSPCLPYTDTTTTFVVSPGDAATYGESVTLTAIISTTIIDNPIPTGKVQFKDGSANLGLPVQLEDRGIASLTTSALSAGQHTLSAEFLANEAYPGSGGSQSFRVNPKTITVSGIIANDKVYDSSAIATLNTSGAVLAGVVNGDSVQLNSTGAQAVFADKNTGNSKPVTVTGLTLSGPKAGNYTLAMPALTASITPRQLTVTAENKRKVYGESIPSLTAAYSGFAPGETSAVLSRLPEFLTTATRTSPVGAYPITITPGSPAAQNYVFTLVNGTLTVEKASTSLQLSAFSNDASYGEPITLTAVVTATAPGNGVPGGTVTFSDGDIILGSAVLSTNAGEGAVATFTTSAFAAGPHEITATFNGDGNFTGSTGSTTISVTPTAELTVSIHASTNPILAGSPLTLTFTAENHGPGTAESTVLHITLPEGLNFQSVTSADGVNCSRENMNLTCQSGDMAASSTQTVTVELEVPRDASGTYSTSTDLDSPSIYLPGGGRPAAETIITVLPRSFVFLPQVTR